MIKKMHITVDASGERLDTYLTKRFSQYSRGYFQRLIKSRNVSVNNRDVVSHYKIKSGDEIDVNLFVEKKDLEAENIPLDIIYEDNDILVVNKPCGMVVHPACGHPGGTLLNAIAGYAKERFAALMVHRLDKDTSGVMVVAKNERAKNSLVKQFQNRTIKKTYFILVKGIVKEENGRIEAPLGRSRSDRKKIVVGPASKKMAVTEFKVVNRYKGFTLLEVSPVTGRTHQIRSHMQFIKHPALGDEVYGGQKKLGDYYFPRQMLHAYSISFTHPGNGKRVSFCAPVAEDMQKIIGRKEDRKKGLKIRNILSVVLVAFLLFPAGLWAQKGSSGSTAPKQTDKVKKQKPAARKKKPAPKKKKQTARKKSSKKEAMQKKLTEQAKEIEEIKEKQKIMETQYIKIAEDQDTLTARLTELNKALFELNEKLELLSGKYEKLVQEIEELRINDQKHERIIIEQSLQKSDDSKVKGIESSLELLRSEISQVREDIGILKSEIKTRKVTSRQEWLHSPWVAVSSLGVALIALLVAL